MPKRGFIEICSFGDIIEFNGHSIGHEKFRDVYVDIITEVLAKDTGKISYLTKMYPDLDGHEHEIRHEDITKVIERKGGNPPEIPEFPVKTGDVIGFDWDGKWITGPVKEACWVLDPSFTEKNHFYALVETPCKSGYEMDQDNLSEGSWKIYERA